MKFKLIPILDKMEAFYKLPRTRERFVKYLSMLQGNTKGDMILPIAGYNPMAKETILLKIEELKNLNAEAIIEKELQKINDSLKDKSRREIEVVLNLSDDIGGAWSNYYTTNYSSKFELNALVTRNFCAPYVWTSESYSEELIAQRTKEYVFRTFFWLNKTKPKKLEGFLKQEVFVQSNSNRSNQKLKYNDFTKIEKFYLEHSKSDDYNLIFNFFLGDKASESLGYATFGMKQNEGFEYAKYLSNQ